MYKYLTNVNSPDDLKELDEMEIEKLANEIRFFLLENVSKTGGHLASNLGVIELTLAMHSVFDTTTDKIVWDVGHQSYVHKLVTGRRNQFESLRQYKGLSGFPKRGESVHDHFETGHSSTSISAALGIATARDLSNETYDVTAIIGDGALSGGMAFEALNHVGQNKTNINIILNDNEMSISENTGGLSQYLAKVRAMPVYSKVKGDVEALINHIPAVGKSMVKTAGKAKDSIKYFFVPGVLFEEIGITYIGPIDGHDYGRIQEALKRAKAIKGPVLVHVLTKKGKGYIHAEERPEKYHGVSSFDISTGKPLKASNKVSFSKVVGRTLVEIAEDNPKITAITAAMPDGTGIAEFSEKFPQRFFDVGIAEQHAVTLAAGQSVAGLHPFFAVYSTFLQRGFDQVLHDVALQNLPLTLLLDRAGVVGADGETHQGIYDIGYLSLIPNLQILSPENGTELHAMIKYSLEAKAPVAIRYPKADARECDFNSDIKIAKGKAKITKQYGDDVVVFAFGPIHKNAEEAVEKLREQNTNATLVNLRFAKPLDQQTIIDLSQKAGRIYTIEDHALIGGVGSHIVQVLNEHQISKPVYRFGYPDHFIHQGSISEIYQEYGMDAEAIANKILSDARPKLRNVKSFMK
ncbi:1-deoxy-D-xylulose-5-phosphate synthase [Isachenkonia alkalipeptolytica]|uniref:1-deoxy-D-xylulose-5-phosphate synthase n=1 Tax=Isachenkonia alkalipeptolytica TaxID=2565777 RepID=A0AA43XM45_9CLOT|nr:1-deoxy-D-xylulose-5-phosphate synthase [Isachenkonia alkalipeptolytica]NBG88779.1 1-deoxy-D-xylulose-5-phosphate synthase [Isachenkonia alkalipeptolytica]